MAKQQENVFNLIELHCFNLNLKHKAIRFHITSFKRVLLQRFTENNLHTDYKDIRSIIYNNLLGLNIAHHINIPHTWKSSLFIITDVISVNFDANADQTWNWVWYIISH